MKALILAIIGYNLLNIFVFIYAENISSTYKSTQFQLLHQWRGYLCDMTKSDIAKIYYKNIGAKIIFRNSDLRQHLE